MQCSGHVSEYLSIGIETSMLKGYLHSHVCCSVIYNQKMESSVLKSVVCKHSEILLRHQKEGNYIISNKIDEPGFLTAF